MVQPERATDELLRIQPTPPGPDDNCPRSLRRRRRPADFPATLPLPPGTLLTDVRRYEPRGFPSFVYVIGFAPLTLQQAARFFALELPRGGYRVTDGEAEDLVVEGRFGGAATGVFRMAALYRCSRFVWMVVGVSTPKRPSSRG